MIAGWNLGTDYVVTPPSSENDNTLTIVLKDDKDVYKRQGGSPFHFGGFPKHLGRLRLRGTADRKDSVPGLAAVRLWNGKLD